MIRKIIGQGHSTLTITLPSKWAKRLNLGVGKEIDIIEKDNGLFITTEKAGEDKKAEFDITGMDIPTIWRYFMVVYREGYNEIVIKFNPELKLEDPYKYFTPENLYSKYTENKKKPAKEVLQSFVSRFIGMEIINYGKDFILVKEMGDITSKEFDSSLRRVFLAIEQMSDETLQAVKENNPKLLHHLSEIDIDLDKFHDYCIRTLNRTGYREQKKTLLFSTIYLLELLGDEIKNIGMHLIKDFPTGKFSNISYLAEYIKQEIDMYYDLFYKFDKKKLAEICELDRKSLASFRNIHKKANYEEKEIFHHLRMIGKYVGALVELRIEMEF